MHSSIRFTTRTSEDGPALIRMRTVESLAVISVVMSAEYQTYGATLLTRSIGDEPVPAKVCQLKLPLVVVLKLRPRIESVADVMVEIPAVVSSISMKSLSSSWTPPAARNGSTNED